MTLQSRPRREFTAFPRSGSRRRVCLLLVGALALSLALILVSSTTLSSFSTWHWVSEGQSTEGSGAGARVHVPGSLARSMVAHKAAADVQLRSTAVPLTGVPIASRVGLEQTNKGPVLEEPDDNDDEDGDLRPRLDLTQQQEINEAELGFEDETLGKGVHAMHLREKVQDESPRSRAAIGQGVSSNTAVATKKAITTTTKTTTTPTTTTTTMTTTTAAASRISTAMSSKATATTMMDTETRSVKSEEARREREKTATPEEETTTSSSERLIVDYDHAGRPMYEDGSTGVDEAQSLPPRVEDTDGNEEKAGWNELDEDLDDDAKELAREEAEVPGDDAVDEEEMADMLDPKLALKLAHVAMGQIVQNLKARGSQVIPAYLDMGREVAMAKIRRDNVDARGTMIVLELRCLTSYRKPVSVGLVMNCGQAFSPTDKRVDTSTLMSTCSVLSKTLQVALAKGEQEEDGSEKDEPGAMAGEQVQEKNEDVDGGKPQKTAFGPGAPLNLDDVDGVPDAVRFLVRRFQHDPKLELAISTLALHLQCGGWIQQLLSTEGALNYLLRGQFQCPTASSKAELETYLRMHPRPASKGEFVTSQFDDIGRGAKLAFGKLVARSNAGPGVPASSLRTIFTPSFISKMASDDICLGQQLWNTDDPSHCDKKE